MALLQRRKTLKPKLEGEVLIDKKPAILLHFDEDIGSTTLAVDKKSGQIVQMKYPTIGGMESKPVDMTITYSDYRPEGKLVYPHASRGEIGGKPVFSYYLEKIVINGNIEIMILAVGQNRVRIGIRAPKEIPIQCRKSLSAARSIQLRKAAESEEMVPTAVGFSP